MASRPSAEEVIASLSKQVEQLVRKRLVGVGGIVIRTHLPQTWTFEVDQEAFTFQMDRQGGVSVSRGTSPSPDVRVVTTYDRLMRTLRTGTPGETPPAAMGVTFGSNRGRPAYFYVRKHLRI